MHTVKYLNRKSALFRKSICTTHAQLSLNVGGGGSVLHFLHADGGGGREVVGQLQVPAVLLLNSLEALVKVDIVRGEDLDPPVTLLTTLVLE